MRTVAHDLRHSFLLSILFFLLFAFVACDDKAEYAYYYALKNSEWQQDNELFFTFPIRDTTAVYLMNLDVRYTPKYPYKNLHVNVIMEKPDRTFDSYQYALDIEMNERDIYAQGYDLFTKSIRLQPRTRFTEKGLYTISVLPLMQDSVLQGIIEVGLRVERT